MGERNCLLMVACNYYRNGSFLGYCTSVNIDTPKWECTVDSPYLDRGLKVDFEDCVIVFGKNKLRLPSGPRRLWVGNWCWDGVRVSERDARRLLRLLAKAGWDMDHGTESVWRWYEKRKAVRHV